MIEVTDSNAVYYYHFDGLGSVVALSDSDGDSVQSYEYTIYGQVAASDPNHPNPYMFTGRRFDIETGLYYYRARCYNQHIGRFMQTDPVGYADGINWYLYCRNNPLAYLDPYGLLVDIPQPGDLDYPFSAAPRPGDLDYPFSAVPRPDSPSVPNNDMDPISAIPKPEEDPSESEADRTDSYNEPISRWDWVREVGGAFLRGAGDGGQILVNEYFFGLPDYIGLTRGDELVRYYGRTGRWSQRLARWSRDAAIAAGGLRYTKFRGPEYGRWKFRGKWHQGWHFHIGRHPSLQQHHLPQQLGNWCKNVNGLYF
jgi:RHS repeat-associated protein